MDANFNSYDITAFNSIFNVIISNLSVKWLSRKKPYQLVVSNLQEQSGMKRVSSPVPGSRSVERKLRKAVERKRSERKEIGGLG